MLFFYICTERSVQSKAELLAPLFELLQVEEFVVHTNTRLSYVRAAIIQELCIHVKIFILN